MPQMQPIPSMQGRPSMPPPPQFAPPPMYMMPPPPPRRGGGFVRGVFTVLATTILGISLTLNIYLLLASGVLAGGSTLRETDILKGDPTQKIAVVPLGGLIDDSAVIVFDRFLRNAEADKNVKGLVIQVDSPGGTVSASDEIHHRIQQFRTNRPGVPIVVSQSGLAASGGYYVSVAADYIFSEPTTLTGSIGVIMPNYNLTGLLNKWGIQDSSIISTGATFKDAGSMTKPIDPQQVAYLQGLIDQSFVQFKSVIANGRKMMTSKEVAAIANGKVYTAAEAKNLKLIDEIGYADDACEYVASKLGLTKKTIVRYQSPSGLLEMLSAKSSQPSPSAATNITINGVHVDSKGLTELLTPRPMYLWRGQ
ncbi:MAG TPA: signal peptide peptidase SppA [Tepidisphaeraceae bacterium]